MGRKPRARDIPRTALTLITGAMATVVAAIAVVILSKVSPTSPLVDLVPRWWGQSWLTASDTGLTVRGLEHVDPDRSYMVVANHQSNMDVFATFVGLPVPVRFLAKKELFRIPFLSSGMRAIGIVEVDRNARGAIREFVNEGTKRLVEAGRSVIIFPEGTRSPDGELLPFKKGAFTMAVGAGLPILPVTIRGAGAAWPVGSVIVRGGHIEIQIDPPLETKDLRMGDSGELSTKVRSIMESNLREWSDGT